MYINCKPILVLQYADPCLAVSRLSAQVTKTFDLIISLIRYSASLQSYKYLLIEQAFYSSSLKHNDLLVFTCLD